MSRYQPSPDEEAALDLLRLAGYAVVRQSTYDRLKERVSLAEHLQRVAEDRSEDYAKWARDCCAEERRLRDRLTAVASSAASLGVPIQAINDALTAATPDAAS